MNPSKWASIPDQLNHDAYTRADVVTWYEEWDTILEPERILFERLLPFIQNKKVLDIGFGGGRTTRVLTKLSSDYTGIDYSPQFVETVKNKYGASVVCCDARDMSRFQDEQFDFILFSFNGIDYMDHPGRLRALGEIYRVLKKGGTFMFSTHNRAWKGFGKLPWQYRFSLRLNAVKDYTRTFLALPRHFRMKKFEVHADDHAIINDSAHDFSLLTYYISIPKQVKQLEISGFRRIEAWDMNGKPVSDDSDSSWIHFTASK